jgi:hypothetical protein
MQSSDSLQQKYEMLASRYAHQGEARQRDHCLVLAADAALSAGQPDQAERLRKRLLLTNPHHLLRPFASMSEAMQSTDVQDYVADLRHQWPPEVVEKLVRQMPVGELPQGQPLDTYPLAEPAPPESKSAGPTRPVKAASKTEPLPPPPATATGFWLALAAFVVGVVLAGGVLALAFAGPFWEP